MMEQMGKTANVMQGTYYSEKLAVDCAIPEEAGGSLSIMQDPGAEQVCCRRLMLLLLLLLLLLL